MILALCYLQIAVSQSSSLKEMLNKLGSDLEQKHKGRDGLKLAILEFRTTDDRLLPFNDFIRDEMMLNYQQSQKFQLIDPFLSAKIATQNGWSMKTVNSFPYYEKLGQQFMEKAGYVPDLYLYGQIQDNDETITITAFLVTTGATDAKTLAAVSFPSSEQTDKLLNKPVKNRKKEKPVPDTIVIEHHIVVEKPVPQDPVTPDPIIVTSLPSENLPSAQYEGFVLQLTQVQFVGQKLHVAFSVVNTTNTEQKLYLTAYRSRIINNDGEEFIHPEVRLGSAESTHSVNKMMVPSVALKGELVFSKIPDGLTIKLLEIGIQDEKITFRDLPVTP